MGSQRHGVGGRLTAGVSHPRAVRRRHVAGLAWQRLVAALLVGAALAPSGALAASPEPSRTPRAVGSPSAAGRPPGGVRQAADGVQVQNGSIVVPQGGLVSATIVSASTAATDDLGLAQPTSQELLVDATSKVGTTVPVGTFAGGTALVFYILNRNDSTTFFSNTGHARVWSLAPGSWQIDFEDWTDWDLNDLVVRIDVAVPTCGSCHMQFGGTPDPNQNNPSGTQTDPVSTYSGAYTTSVTDLALPGRGFGFALTRTYDSGSAGVDGPFGPGWATSYGDHLTLNPDGSATFVTATGAVLPFASDGGGGFVAAPGVLSTLSVAAGGYAITRHDGFQYLFDSAGRLTAETERNTNTITLGYTGADLTSIVDTVGRTVTLAYDGAHRVVGLVDPIGRAVGYAYDAAGRLASVTDTRGGVTTYGYDIAGRLTTITDQNGHTLVTNTYDAAGRVIGQLDGLGHQTTFAYAVGSNPYADSSTTTMTDALGAQWVDGYIGPALVWRRNPLGFVTYYAYDAQFALVSATDPVNANPWSMTYDGRGNLLSRTTPAPLSYVESFTYDASNDLLTATDRRGLTTTYTYDSAGNLLRATWPDGGHVDGTYDCHGLALTRTDERGMTTTFAYDARADVVSVTTPLGATTTAGYDVAGRMTSLVDPRGNAAGGDPAEYRTLLGYDPADHLVSVTDPLGNTATATYDPAGNPASVTDADNHTTAYAYDAGNHLIAVTDATGGVTSYAYDAVGGLVSRTDALGHATVYTYDTNHMLHTTTDPDGNVWHTEHTSAGVPTGEGGAAGAIGYMLDALGRPTRINYQTTYTLNTDVTYDPDGNRLTVTGGPYATTQTYGYDTRNRLVSAADSWRGGPSFAYAYDAAGNVLSRTYPDGSIVRYTYDDDGRMATVSTLETLTPPTDTTVPSTPTGLTASAVSTSQVDLTWSAATDDVGVAGYKLYRNGAYASTIGPIGSTSISDTGLASGSTYIYAVSAIDAAGNESAQSGTASATPGPDATPPTVPSGLTATAGAANRVDLTWTAATDNVGVTAYRVYRAGVLLFSVAGTATGASDWSVTPSSSFSYTVSAVDAAGNASAASTPASVTTPAGSGTTYAADAFTRTVSGGWGTADAGGAWTGTTSAFAVNGSAATVSLGSATTLNAYLTSVAAGDQEVLVTVKVSQFATGGNTDASILLRRQDASNTYVARLAFTPSRQIQAFFARTAGGTTTTIGSATSSLTHVKTDTYWLRVQLSGTTTVNAKLRVWKVGTAEPSTWLVNANDTTPPTQLRGTGHAGVRFAAAGSGPFPILGTFDALRIDSIGSLASPDLTAPSVPTGLATTPRSSSRIDLAWSASSDASGVQAYRVYRGSTLVATVNSPAYIDTGLTANTTYSYKVAALDPAGNASAQTGIVTGRTLGSDTTAPSVPSAVVADASVWNTVTVTWTASTDNVGVTRYRVYRGGAQISAVGGSVTTFTDRTTAASTAYSYTVRAVDGAANASAASAAAQVTTPAAAPVPMTTTYGYDAAGNLTSEATPDGVTARSTYDRAGRLIEVANVTATATLSRASYRLDAAGNRIAMTTTRGTQYYTYDALDRLIDVCYAASCAGTRTPVACIECVGAPLATPPATVVPDPADTFVSYTYDAVGNRLTETTYRGTTVYAYDPADRLTTRTPPGGPPTTYTYDALGRQTSAGPNTSFTFDLAGNLIDAWNGSVEQAIYHTGDGVRESWGTTVATPLGDSVSYDMDRQPTLSQVAAERDGYGDVARSYTYGLSLISERTTTGGPVFLHTDGLGSVTDITSANGAPLAWTEYQPFGAVRSSGAAAGAPAVPFAYAGQYRDPTGLYDMRARAYDPATGRFLSVDPMPGSAGDPAGSSYVYVRNNPAVWVDPSGRCLQFFAAAAVSSETVVGAFGFGALGFLCLGVVWVGAEMAGQAAASAVKQWSPPGPIPFNDDTGDQTPGGPARLPPGGKYLVPIIAGAVIGSVLLGDNQK